MASLTKTFTFNTASQVLPYTAEGGSWAYDLGAGLNLAGTLDTTSTYESTNDAAAGNGGLRSRRTGKNQSGGSPSWRWTGTWVNLGVPTGAVMDTVNMTIDWAQPEFTTGAAGFVGGAELRDSTGTTTLASMDAGGVATPAAAQLTWTTRAGSAAAIPVAAQPAATTITLVIFSRPNTGNSNSAAVSIGIDLVKVDVVYHFVSDPPYKNVNNRVQTVIL